MSNNPRFAQCLEFINWQLKPGDGTPLSVPPARKWRGLTISRETGCATGAITEQLVKNLQAKTPDNARPWVVFDQNLLELVLADHNLPRRIASFMPEARTPFISDVMEELLGLHPSAWVLIQQMAQTILQLAELGNVILVGRAANVITSRLPHVFHVRLIGSLERRLARVQAARQLDRKAALELIHREDRNRSDFLRQHFQKDIADPLQYHVTINTDQLSAAEVAGMICKAMGYL